MRSYKFVFLATSIFFSSCYVFASDGTMRFSGKVLAGTCTVTTPAVNVPLGSYPKNTFTGVGSTSSNVSFQVLLDCDAQAKITITVNATQDPSNIAGVVSLDSSNESATGVGVQILQGNGTNVVALNQPWVIGTTSIKGVSNINMYGRYYQTKSEITAGTANATAQFTMNYN